MAINDTEIDRLLKQYQESFSSKMYSDNNDDTDVLMSLYGITPDLKRENKQYWGRELGMVWEKLTKEYFKTHNDFREAGKTEFGTDKPVDYFVGNLAIDTKYRVGSGDSGTLKKFKEYGKMLISKGYEPVFLFLRDDNLAAAITAARSGGWTIYTGEDTFKFIQEQINIDLKEKIAEFGENYLIER